MKCCNGADDQAQPIQADGRGKLCCELAAAPGIAGTEASLGGDRQVSLGRGLKFRDAANVDRVWSELIRAYTDVVLI